MVTNPNALFATQSALVCQGRYPTGDPYLRSRVDGVDSFELADADRNTLSGYTLYYLVAETREATPLELLEHHACVHSGARTVLPDNTVYLHCSDKLGVRITASIPVAGTAWSSGGDPYRDYCKLDVYRTRKGVYIVHSQEYNNSGSSSYYDIDRYVCLEDLIAASASWPTLREAIEGRTDWLATLPLENCEPL